MPWVVEKRWYVTPYWKPMGDHIDKELCGKQSSDDVIQDHEYSLQPLILSQKFFISRRFHFCGDDREKK
jgi:hypothetical protein